MVCNTSRVLQLTTVLKKNTLVCVSCRILLNPAVTVPCLAFYTTNPTNNRSFFVPLFLFSPPRVIGSTGVLNISCLLKRGLGVVVIVMSLVTSTLGFRVLSVSALRSPFSLGTFFVSCSFSGQLLASIPLLFFGSL